MKEAKEEAKELVEEFQSISGHLRFSKQYALICVEDKVKWLESFRDKYVYFTERTLLVKLEKELKELKEVKQEINKL